MRSKFIEMIFDVVFPACIQKLESGCNRPYYHLRFVSDVVKIVSSKLLPTQLAKLASCLTCLIKSRCDKPSAHAALAIVSHLISSATAEAQESFSDCVVDLVGHFARSPTRGMLLS